MGTNRERWSAPFPASSRGVPSFECAMTEPVQPDIPLRAARAAQRAARDGSWNGDAPASLAEVAAGVQLCRRCELWRDATQGVAGAGPTKAALMLVGEQPG